MKMRLIHRWLKLMRIVCKKDMRMRQLEELKICYKRMS